MSRGLSVVSWEATASIRRLGIRTDQTTSLSVHQRVEDAIETTGVLDCLLQPERILIVPIASIHSPHPILGIPLGFVILDRRENKNQRHRRVLKVQFVKGPDVFELEGLRGAKVADELVEDVGVGLEGDEVLCISGGRGGVRSVGDH